MERNSPISFFPPNTSGPRIVPILAHQRSGSTLLCSILAKHPQMTVDTEIFSTSHEGWWNSDPLPGWSIERRGKDPKGFLEQVTARVRTPIYIFKMLSDHHPAVWKACLAPDRPRIVIYRENRLRAYLSGAQALRSDRWHELKGESFSAPPLTFSQEDYLEFDRVYRDPVRRLAQDPHPLAFATTYEKLFCAAHWEKLFEFLGVAPIPISTPLRKLGGQPIRSTVANYSEMEAQLNALGHQGELESWEPGEL